MPLRYKKALTELKMAYININKEFRWDLIETAPKELAKDWGLCKHLTSCVDFISRVNVIERHWEVLDRNFYIFLFLREAERHLMHEHQRYFCGPQCKQRDRRDEMSLNEIAGYWNLSPALTGALYHIYQYASKIDNKQSSKKDKSVDWLDQYTHLEIARELLIQERNQYR